MRARIFASSAGPALQSDQEELKFISHTPSYDNGGGFNRTRRN